MAKASAPPEVPTPICRIEVVKAAIPPSPSAKSRRSRDFLRFRQRANQLVELLCGRVFFFLREHQLRLEEEAALFRQVSPPVPSWLC